MKQIVLKYNTFDYNVIILNVYHHKSEAVGFPSVFILP